MKKVAIFMTAAILSTTCVLDATAASPKSEPLSTDLNSFDPANWNVSNWTNGGMFNCGWKPDHVTFKDGFMTLNLTKEESHGRPYTSGEFRSNKKLGYGTFEVRMKAAKGDGLVSSFFTYTGPSNGDPWDEIDFEILGKDTTKVQLNYFTNGKGDHEKLIDLGFDASEDFHVYAFKWTKGKIEWYVDGKLVHTVKGSGLPTHPQQIMVNLWPGITVDAWLKPFTYDGKKQAVYDYIKYTPEGK